MTTPIVSLEDEDGEAIENSNPLPIDLGRVYERLAENNRLLKMLLLAMSDALDVAIDPLKEIEI